MSDSGDVLARSINLEAFEKMVYLRNGSPESWENIIKQLFEILHQIRVGSGFLSAPDDIQAHCYTRLAGAITAFMTDPNFGLTEEGFVRLCANHTQIHSIFRASTYESMDHILGVIGTRPEANPTTMTFDGLNVPKLLVCWALDSEIEIDFEAVARANPGLAAQAMIGMLSVGGSHSQKSYQRRLMLMRNRGLIAAQALHPGLIQSAGDCYMHCSYTDAYDKHEIKRVINDKLFETIGGLLKIEECTTKLVRKARPTIVMPLEWFGVHHAMYRCYAPSVMQLKERFRVVGVFRDNAEVDEEGQKVFDKVVKLGDANASIQAMLAAIKEEQPDIMYYPSLGMAAWYVALSNFRLAPIQIISPGHPATSMSKCIDYIVSDGDLFGDPSDYIEKLVPLETGTVRYIAQRQWSAPVRAPRTDDTIKLAIPAMVIKLVPPFLETLQRIQREAKRKVEFHFFPNMTGLNHFAIVKELKRWFPDCFVAPRAEYPTYMGWLAQCDLMASTFPFGGTNSTIDCFLIGMPVLTLEGPHVHGRSDASMMRRVKLPDWLITHSADEYVAAALRFIDGPAEEREALRRHLEEFDVEREFYGEAPEHLKGGFLKAFEKLYEENLENEA